MMKNIMTVGLVVLLFSSCYERGPWFSVASKKGRLDNNWSSLEMFVDGKKDDNGEDSIFLSINGKSGFISFKRGANSDSTYYGSWEFINNKSKMKVTLDKLAGQNYNQTDPNTYKAENIEWEWEILELRSKRFAAMWTEDNGKEVDVTFVESP